MLRALSIHKSSCGRSARCRQQVRLALEALEERCVPSATVQVLGDFTGSLVGTQQSYNGRTVARDTNTGNYAVTWMANDPTHNGIYARLFRADNTPLTGPVHIASTIYGNDYDPNIAMNAQGQFAVAWTHRYGSSTGIGDTDIFVQRFSANGLPTYQRVVAMSDHSEFDPSVALDNFGNLMVAYTYQYSSSDLDVYVWTERPTGLSTFKLATSSNNEYAPSLALNASGLGVVAFQYDYSDDDRDIYARRVSTGVSTGPPGAIGGNIAVITTGDDQFDPSVSINPSNSFVVSYTEDVQYVQGHAPKVFARQFDAANNYRGGVGVRAASDTTITTFEGRSSVAMDYAGRFIVAYDRYQGVSTDVLAQVFNSDNTAQGLAFDVSARADIGEFNPTVALGVADLTSAYSGGGYYYGQAIFSFQTFGQKNDVNGNQDFSVSIARLYLAPPTRLVNSHIAEIFGAGMVNLASVRTSADLAGNAAIQAWLSDQNFAAAPAYSSLAAYQRRSTRAAAGDVLMVDKPDTLWARDWLSSLMPSS
jgi:hypothetical protein